MFNLEIYFYFCDIYIILDYLLKILQYLNKKILKYLKKKKYIIFLLFK